MNEVTVEMCCYHVDLLNALGHSTSRPGTGEYESLCCDPPKPILSFLVEFCTVTMASLLRNYVGLKPPGSTQELLPSQMVTQKLNWLLGWLGSHL